MALRSKLAGYIVLAAICAEGTIAPVFAQTYRWRDEKGIVHYGDSVPARYKDSARVELNEAGVAIRKTEQALTPEQRAQREAQRAAEAAAAEKTEFGARLDRALMTKFANVRELKAAHDRELALTDEQLESFTIRATDLSESAFELLKLKRRTRDQRLELGRLSNDLTQVADALEKKMAERVSKAQRQATERARFEALTSQATPAR